MKSEWNNSGKEFADSVEIHQPKDLSGYVPVEFAQPQKEFADLGCEFIEEKAVESNAETAYKKQEKKSTDKLLRKMSYMVTAAVAVVMLSATLSDSGNIKNHVAQAGGFVHGALRFSIQWNEDGRNPNDFDAHCIEPGEYEIYFGNARVESPSKGMLDIDIINPGDELAVENIVYPDRTDLNEGTYRFCVHNYSHNGGKNGFSAEIEIRGKIYYFSYDKELQQGETVEVAEVTWKNGRFSIDKKID